MSDHPAPSETISYLGPAGTFTEAALRLAPAAVGKFWKPVNNVPEALAEVQAGTSFAAMIAVENSIEGSVTASQDALATMPGLRIVGEYIVPIRFVLAAQPGVRLEDVRTVAAHPVAYGQCRRWLAQHIPAHLHLPASSNIASAGMLFDGNLADAAIAPPTIGERLKVDVLATDIQDTASARTRFVLVTSDHTIPERTGNDKTSLIVELPEERPGGLMQMLEQFAARGINLSMIASRPIAESPGRYRFVIDLDGHIDDARVKDALLGLRRFSPDVLFLGSYPCALPTAVELDPAYSDEHYAEAERWFDSLRE